MEKISAAFAMEWSIELEKGLRSKRPGQSVDAIKQTGPRLQQWSMEPAITRAISDMYGLVPGEDRTFANTILLRLADVFKCGDNDTRVCILKVFLLEYRHLSKKGKSYNGILSKRRVPNYVELLKRVKLVFDTGNAEAKALALRLFGCWADLGKDSPQIRYMILLSLQSSHVSEVKASLFAAGCFCLLSDDFACIILEILVGIISSLQASSGVTLGAIRAFSKMRCSPSIASRAHKAGKELVMCSLQEEFKAEMLLSLSKLAYKSTLLFTKQVDLLLSYLSGEHASLVKARALKCLYFLFCSGSCLFPVIKNGLDKLIPIIDDKAFPLNFQCEALQILRKIFCSTLPDQLLVNMPYLFNLVMIVEKAALSSVDSKRCLALRLLVDILCSLKRARGGRLSLSCDKWQATCFQFQRNLQATTLNSVGDGPALVVCHVMSFIINHIASLMKQMFFACDDELICMGKLVSCGKHSGIKHECRSLLSLILHLAVVHPSSGLVALDGMRYLIQTLASVHEKISKVTAGICEELPQIEMVAEKSNVAFRHRECDNKDQIYLVSELISWICRFSNACLNILEETSGINGDPCHQVKLLVHCIQQSGSYDCDTYEIFSLSMHSCVACHCRGINNNNTQNSNQLEDVRLGFFHNVCWVGQECRTLAFTKQMLTTRNRWAAYRAGKYSCCEGLWFAATYTFRKLIDCVQSDSCRCWLRSLMLFSGGESEIKLLLFPKIGIELLNGFQTESNCGKPCNCDVGDMRRCVDVDANLHDCEGRLARVHFRICSSEEILAAAGASDGVYYFQRWFLSLRAKVLEILVDMFGLLSSHACTEENLDKNEVNAKIHSTAVVQNMDSLVFGFASISKRLNKLANEYDLLATSFIDIDCRSSRSISKLALDCSLLSFCTAFVLFSSNLPAYKNGISSSSGNLERFPRAVILQDLVERLWDMDDKITTELQRLMNFSGEVIDNLQFRTHINSAGRIESASLLVCRFALSGVLQMQEEAKGIKDEELCLLFKRGLQLLSSITRKWMVIPFQTPKYFFTVRPCIGTELFLFNADSQSPHQISVSLGFQLPLNLCVQLKNLPTKPRARVAKLYCILAAKLSDRLASGEREGQLPWGFHARNADEMVELTEMLLMYVRADTKKASRIHAEARDGGDLVTTACACFEPNEKGQGFSACLLDVSAFPVGSYQIKWHSCCIDNSGSLWSLLPLNTGSVFTIKRP